MKLIVHATALLLAGAVANAQDIALSSATIEISPGDAQSAGLRGMPGDASVTLIAKDAESKLVGVSFLPLDPTALYRALPPSIPCPIPDGSAFRLWPYVVAPSTMNSDLACIYKGKVTRCTGSSSGQPPDFEARIVHVDIDVDSDNTSDPIPEQKKPKQQPYPPIAGAAPEADAQDAIENPQASDALGLLLVVNHGFDSTPYEPTAPREDFQRPNIETVAATDPDLSRGRIAMVAKKNGYLKLTYELAKLRIYRNDGSAPVLMRPGVDIPLAPMELPILLEGVDPGGSDGGTNFSATFRDVDHQSPNKPAEDIVKITVVDLQIQVDRDRNGTVTGTDLDLTDADHPMVFWLNNDKDDAQDDTEPTTADYADFTVANLRDLEDFQRFILRVRGVNQHVTSGKLSMGLRWMEGNQGKPQVHLYRHSALSANQFYTSREPQAKSLLVQALRIGVYISDLRISRVGEKWFRANGDALQAPTLWEANAGDGSRTPAGTRPPDPATGRLGLVIGKRESGIIRAYALNRHIHLRLGDMRWFYEHKSAGDTVTSSSSFPGPALTALGDGMTDLSQRTPHDLNDPDLATLKAKDKTIIFVHGYRMQPWERRSFAETALKRLYWQGYGGRFVFFSWPTDYVAGTPGQIFSPQNYDRSEFQARRSGASVLPSVITDVRRRLCQQDPQLLCISGHSMGNIVVSEAMRRFSVQSAGLYLSFQSADLAGCFKYDVPRLVPSGLALALDSKVYTPDLYRFDAPRQPRSLVTWPEWRRALNPAQQFRNRLERLEPVTDGLVRHQAIRISAGRRVTYFNGVDKATSFALVGTQVSKPDRGFSYFAELLNTRTAPAPLYRDVFRISNDYLSIAPWNALPGSTTGAADLAWTATASNFGGVGPLQTMQNAAIIAFCARGSTTAVGATNGSRMIGASVVDPYGRPLPAGANEAPFTGARNSQTGDGFSDGDLDHSGQFNYHIQRNPGPFTFWKHVLTQVGAP